MGIKGNEEADKMAKQAINIPGMTTDYCLTTRRAKIYEWQKERENNYSKLHYIKPYIEE